MSRTRRGLFISFAIVSLAAACSAPPPEPGPAGAGARAALGSGAAPTASCPEIPTTLTPGGTIDNRTPTFCWTAVPGIDEYAVDVLYAGPDGGYVLGEAASTSDTCLTLAGLPVGVPMRWKVKVECPGGGYGDFSRIVYFDIGGPNSGGPRGDFDWDASPDLFWQNETSGRTVVWTQRNLHRLSGQFTNPMGYGDTQWKAVAINDFNGDGKSDVVFQHTGTHDIVVALYDHFQRVDSVSPTPSHSDYDVVGSGDFNGDRQADLLLQNPADHHVYIWLMAGTARIAEVPTIPALYDAGGAPWQVVAGADFNLDGKDDIAWRNPTDGSIDVWLMDGRQLLSYHGVVEAPGPSWQFGAVGHFASDGAQTVLLEDGAGALSAYVLSVAPDLLYQAAFDPTFVAGGGGWRLLGPR